MKNILQLVLLLTLLQSCAQTKADYLKNNSLDLNSSNFDFPQKNFKIIGFGAYHGSAKTEDVEIDLLKSLTKDGGIKYYLPETDFSIAHYFNEFLKTGDTILLRDLVKYSGVMVAQERTIEVYEKWKTLKKLNDNLPSKDKLKVIGIDVTVRYKYISKHLLELLGDSDSISTHTEGLRRMLEVDTTSYVLGDKSFAYKKLKKFVDHFEANKILYRDKISNVEDFNHIISNLKITFNTSNIVREKVIYDNYLALDKKLNFSKNSQFLRMGFSHIQKSREGKDGFPYFFARLIENNIYDKEDVISVTGFLTNSEVVWDELYDNDGNYTSYTTEAGFGIGDYEKEYFRGIQNLKDAKISDKTLFRLNKENSPYKEKEPDLVEVVMTEEKSNGEAVKNMSTLDFLDYAVLISNSNASTPIFEMN